jgi:hypothetical protein
MALDPITLTGIFTSSMNANSLLGAAIPQLAGAVANGLIAYAASGITVVTVDTGLAGSGTGIGFGIILATPVLQGTLSASLAGASMLGTAAIQLANALAAGFSQALGMANINTIHAGVGSGTGVVTLVPSSGIMTFNGAFSGAGLIGVSANILASAIATGFDSALSSATGVVTITGAAGTSPAAGAGSGIIS